MRIRVPNDQYEAAVDYLHEKGYQICHTKPKSHDEILIIAKKSDYIFNSIDRIFPESLDYIHMKEKFQVRAKMIQFDKKEEQ